MNLSGGGLFDLQASLSVDTSGIISELEDAIDTAEELASALEDADGGSIDINAEVSGQEDVEALGQSIEDLGEDGAAGTAAQGVSTLEDKIINGLAGMATIAAIGKVASEIGKLASEYGQTGDAIDKNSQKLGLSRVAYQEWDYVLSQAGGDIDSLQRGINTMRTKIDDPDKGTTKAFKDMGLSIKEVQNMSTEDAFSAIITALQNMDDEEAKVTAAGEIFGTMMASQMIPLLNTSSKDTQKLKDKAHELGMVMSNDGVDNAVAYTDAMDTLDRTWAAFKLHAMEAYIPILTDAAGAFSTILGVLNGDDSTLAATLESLTGSVTSSISSINSTELDATSIINAMEQLGNPKLFTEEQSAQWDAYYAKLCEVVPGIEEQFGKELKATEGATEALRTHVTALMDDAKATAVKDAVAKREALLADAYEAETDALINLNIAKEKAGLAGDAAAGIMGTFSQEQLNRINQFKDATGAIDWGGLLAVEESLGYIDQIALTPQQLDTLRQSEDATRALGLAEKEYAEQSEALEKAKAETQAWIDALYELAEVDPDKDYGITKAAQTVSTKTKEIKRAVEDLAGTYEVVIDVQQRGQVDNYIPQHKNGLDYVPYDNYLAYLHEGERVLTKSEAEDYNSGGANVAALAAAIAARPISFSVGDTALATSISTASSRANAQRAAAISSGYGRGM